MGHPDSRRKKSLGSTYDDDVSGETSAAAALTNARLASMAGEARPPRSSAHGDRYNDAVNVMQCRAVAGEICHL